MLGKKLKSFTFNNENTEEKLSIETGVKLKSTIFREKKSRRQHFPREENMEILQLSLRT